MTPAVSPHSVLLSKNQYTNYVQTNCVCAQTILTMCKQTLTPSIGKSKITYYTIQTYSFLSETYFFSYIYVYLFFYYSKHDIIEQRTQSEELPGNAMQIAHSCRGVMFGGTLEVFFVNTICKMFNVRFFPIS